MAMVSRRQPRYRPVPEPATRLTMCADSLFTGSAMRSWCRRDARTRTARVSVAVKTRQSKSFRTIVVGAIIIAAAGVTASGFGQRSGCAGTSAGQVYPLAGQRILYLASRHMTLVLPDEQRRPVLNVLNMRRKMQFGDYLMTAGAQPARRGCGLISLGSRCRFCEPDMRSDRPSSCSAPTASRPPPGSFRYSKRLWCIARPCTMPKCHSCCA